MSDYSRSRGGSRVAGKHQSRPGESQPGSQRAPRKKKGFPSAALVAALVVVVALGAGIYTYHGIYLDSDIRDGVRMGTVDLSGMTRSQARAALEKTYGGGSLDESIDVKVGDQTFTLTAKEAGITYDIPRSVDGALAYGREGDFSQRLHALWDARRKGVQLEMQTTMDDSVLQMRVNEIASQIERPLSPSSWSYADGVVTIDKGQPGYSLDAQALMSTLQTKLRSADFTPADAVLREAAPQKLSASEIYNSVVKEPTETRLDLEADPSGNTVTAGQPGVLMDEAALQKALSSDERRVTVPCQLVSPKYTVAEYKALLFRDVLGQGTTGFNPGNVGRTTNVRLATDFCNNTILMPGDVFSYNDTVGPRTYERGFKDAIVYVGTSAEDGVGGGICQVSSTIYYAVLRADLKIVERYAHSREVTYVPKGEDATVAWGSKDFRFENDTEFPIKVVTSHDKNSLTIKLYGTQTQNKTVKIETTINQTTPFEVERELDTSLAPGTEKVVSNGYTGYKTTSYRVVYIDGREVSRTLENNSTYKKYNKVIHYNPAPEQPVGPAEPVTPVTPPAEPAPGTSAGGGEETPPDWLFPTNP